MADLKVRISSAKRRYGYGETIHLRAEVENVSKRALLLVMGRIYPGEPASGTMAILHAQTECDANTGYFAFRPPELKRLGPGRKTNIELAIAMPLHRYGLDANGRYAEWEAPVSGAFKLAVSLGYLPGPFRPKTADPWREFTRMQKLSAPTSTAVQVDGP